MKQGFETYHFENFPVFISAILKMSSKNSYIFTSASNFYDIYSCTTSELKNPVKHNNVNNNGELTTNTQ